MKTTRRVMSVVLAIAMILTTFGMVTVSAAAYSDTAGHWAESYINVWSDYGVIQGDGGYFRPDDAITRAEVAQVTQNVIGYEDAANNGFIDVPAGAWYEDAILKLAAAGTLTGNGDGTMSPDNYMTREEAMTMLARAYGLTVENSQAGITQYADYQTVSDYATGYVGAMTAAGYVGGYEDGTVRPQANISRAEFVKILDNMIKLYITAPGTYGPGYYGGIAMVKVGGVTLNGVVGNGAVISPQVSGEVSLQNCQFTGNTVNLSKNANVTSNTGVNSTGDTINPGTIFSGNGGGPGVGPGSGSTVSTYTVKFYNGTTLHATRTVSRNAYLKNLPIDPVSKGKVFVGWYSSKAAADDALNSEEVDFASTRITRNTSVYAGFVDADKAPTATPKATADPSVPTSTPEATTDPSVPTSTPEATTDPSAPTATPVVTTEPSVPTATPKATDAPTAKPVLYKATLNVENGTGTLAEKTEEAVALAEGELPEDQAWTILDSDLVAAVTNVAKNAPFGPVRGLSGYGEFKTNSSKVNGATYTHTDGKTYDFQNKAFVTGSGNKTSRCFYFTPQQACIVTVAYAGPSKRAVYIYQGDTLLASGDETVVDGKAAVIEADIEDPSLGDVYVYGGGSDKDIYGIFADYYDPAIVVYRTLSGNINYAGAETGLKVRFTDEKDGTTYEVDAANGAYSVNLRQNRNYAISVVDASGTVSDKVAPTLDTNSVSIKKMDKSQDIDLVDIAPTEVTGDVVVHDYNNDGTSLDLSSVQLTFTAKDDPSYTYTTGITDNKIAVTMMPNHIYAITATGIDGYELSQLSGEYIMAAGDTAPFKNILIEEVLGDVPFSATVKVGANQQYAKINDAIAAIEKMTNRPAGEDGRVTVEIDPGIYTEQVRIAPSYVTLKAADASNRPEIQWYYGIGYLYYSAAVDGYFSLDAAVQKTARGAVQRWGTACRPTGQYVHFQDIIIRHTFNCFVTPEEIEDGVMSAGAGWYGDVQGKPDRTVENYDAMAKNATERAAAITLDGNYSEIYNCDFISSQDTFYTNNTAYVKDCYIEGGTDYIFGGNSILFDGCTLAWHGYSDAANGGYITACKTSAATDNGYMLKNCTVTNSKYYPNNKFAAGSWGRNWGGADCQVVFDGIVLDGVDTPGVWVKMGGELSTSILYVTNVTKNGNTVDTKAYNPNGTMEANGYTEIADTAYFGGTWIPPHYDKQIVVSEYTTTWNFGISNGAETYNQLQGAGAIVEIAGLSNNPEAQILTVNAENGKFNNSGRSDEWAQVNDGTTFKIPVVDGTVITFNSYQGAGSFTIDGKSFGSGEEYTYNGEAGYVTATAAGVAYVSYIKTVSPASVPNPTAKPTTEPGTEPTNEPTTEPTTEPTPTNDPNVFWFEEGAIVGFTGTPSTAGAAAKMVVTKVSDNSTVEVSANNTFVMPAEEVKVEVVYEELSQPYSEWKQGQASADRTDGSMKIVEFEGKTALDITGRNVYTSFDEAVKEGIFNYNGNVYVGPDTTAFRIYLENANAANYQDAANAVQAVYSDAGSQIVSGDQSFALTGTTAGWYNIDITADYDKVGENDFITVVVTSPAGEAVITATMPASNGVDAGIKQVRLISRGTAGESDVYFADMTAGSKTLKPGVDDPIVAQETAKVWTAADNYDELLSKAEDTANPNKFNIYDMNMDNLFLRSSTGKKINYEDVVAENNSSAMTFIDTENPGCYKFADGLVVPAKVLNFRVGTELEFIPSTTKNGKLKLYYKGQTAGAAIVTVTQGETVTAGVIGDEGETVVVDVKAGENVVVRSDLFGWLAAVTYIPEDGSESEPSATPGPTATTPASEPTATTPASEPTATAPASEPTATAPVSEPTATAPTGTPKPTQGPIDYAVDFTNQNSTNSILTADEVSGKTSVSFGLNAAGERVSADSEDAVWTFDSFKYHSEEHGLNPGSVVVSVPGPVKITYGTCAWGGDVTVKDSGGNTVATFNTNNGTCYHNNKTTNIVESYYKGEATTLTMSGGSYVPYVAVKTVDASEIPNDATITFANGTDTFEGTLPAEITEDIGTEVTLPLNRTMYIDGKTLTAWNDGTNNYAPGSNITLTSDVTLTPVFTANEKTLSGTVTFDFQRKNGAPTLAWQNVNKIYVSQATVDGTPIDVKMDVDTNNGGKVANANWTDWAQFGVGTKFTIPVAVGSVVTMGETYSSGGQYTINGVEKSGDNQSETATAVGTMEVVITGGNYYRAISVAY